MSLKTIPFLSFKIPAVVFSTVLIIGLFAVTFMRGGFNLGIDFRSGLSITVTLDGDYTEEAVNATLTDIDGTSVRRGEGFNYIISVTDNGQEDFQSTTETAVMDNLTANFGMVELQSSDFVAPSSSSSLVYNTIFIVVVAFVLIMAYIWLRFKTFDYSVSALVSTLHDVLVVVGFIGAMRFEVNTVTIAAVLTIIGYSLNDTVVIFDRIRESFHTVKDQTYSGIIDIALTQTLNRTVITSLTTIVAILPLMVLAMGSVQLFAIEMFVGVLVGTYSSLFVGSVSLNAMHEGRIKKLNKNKK